MRRSVKLAKLSLPSVERTLARPRLFEALDDLFARARGVWLAAPPGSGKTTLAASYFGARGSKALWYHVDRGDGDAGTLFHYLAQTLDAFTPRKRVALPAYGVQSGEPLDAFARRFFRAFYALLPNDASIVFDDFQSAEGAAFHDVLRTALVELPQGVRCLVTSRAQPPDALLDLEIGGTLARLDAEALLFNEAETTALVNARLGRTSDDVCRVFRLTQGWAAGLMLVCDRLARQGDAFAQVERMTREAVFRYFATQIFDAHDADTQRVLMHAALLPEVSERAATTLCGDARAVDVLEAFHARQLFVSKQISGNARYRFHDLFRDFLLTRLTAALDANTLARTRVAAARLLLEDEFSEAAVALMIEAQAWPELTRTLRELAPTLYAEGRISLLRDWVGALPARVRESFAPELMLWLAIAHYLVDDARYFDLLEQTYARFAAAGDRVGMLRTAAHVTYRLFVGFSLGNQAREWPKRFESKLTRETAAALEGDDRALIAVATLAVWRMCGGFKQSPLLADAVHQALAVLEDIALPAPQRFEAGCELTFFALLSIDRALGERVLPTVSALYAEPSVAPHWKAEWCLRVSQYIKVFGDCPPGTPFTTTQQAIEAGIAIAQRENLVLIESRAQWYLTVDAMQRGNAVGAAEAIRRRETLNPNPAPPMVASMLGLKAGLALLQGRYAEALELSGNALLRDPQMLLAHSSFPIRLHAEALMGLGRETDAVAWCDKHLSHFVGRQKLGLELTRRAALALRARRARADDYRSVLRALVHEASQARDRSILLGAHALVRELLHDALDADIHVPFALEVMRERNMAPRADCARWPWPVRVVTLGRFAVEVNGASLAFEGKAPRKPLELLKSIVACNNFECDVTRLIDTLWPDLDANAVRASFDMAVKRLRGLLACDDALLVREGKLLLNTDRVWVDTRAFESLAAQSIEADCNDVRERALALYRGAFLEDESAAGWTTATRERLRAVFMQLVTAQAAALESRGHWREALRVYERALAQDTLAEELYRGAIRCHLAQGEVSAALRAFRRCRELLSIVLGVSPARETISLIESAHRAAI